MNILLVGQGLAGTVLSHYLFLNNIDHKVLDDGHKTCSTKAAAGLINPITGRNYVKSWRIDDLLPEALSCYEQLERDLNLKLISHRDIIRALPDAVSENKWISSTSRPGYENYCNPDFVANSYAQVVHSKGKYAQINKAIQVNIADLIICYRQFLIDRKCLIEDAFDFEKYDLENDLKVGDEKFDKVIFCEGSAVDKNPLFNHLPFQPAKGESFNIQIDGDVPKQILRDDIFLIPQADGSFWSGGGYQWQFEDDHPTENWATNWKGKLDQLLKVGYEVKAHKAGIRPAVKGRRPLLGQHDTQKQYYLFNGMGTKGTSLAPYWAKHFVEYLMGRTDLDVEVDLKRFTA